ncbi:hypothetical protein BHE74_00043097 [Ensete ventricosum]|nr:hypothetical protein BHE74_00043097 [Ensete ventricosum]
MELQPDDRPRSSLSIGTGFGRCSGISPKFARRSPKVDRKTHRKNVRGCQIGRNWGREKNVKIDKIVMCERLVLPREIVYPSIPYPDGEDEGGQASSSLAVSTRWISTAELLQSCLATLAQREGGE